ncbi:MAG: Gfo/Idh/MocA family oxidoreductase [Verrucomicrobiaceae bacterium]|nr:Gfo/Idh/MocA family oxidoreductase [Verrucomicrobiaceae bacterium]
MNRRKFIKTASTAAAAGFVLPRFSIAQSRKSANEKLNVAFVGVGGIGAMALNGMKSENIVALCDLDMKYSARNIKRHCPNHKAQIFTDYREMLDKCKDIDAVCVSTPDHSHFKITIDAMSAGKHVAVQKPLVHNIWQCRELKKAAKYHSKLKTQMMNQGHATEQIRMLREWYESGVTGGVNEVHVLCGGPSWWQGKGTPYFVKPKVWPLTKDTPPADFNFDLWLNQAQEVPFHRNYHPLAWRGFWDFGTGMLGDWFCHTGDAPVWILDLKAPSKVELIDRKGDFDPKVFIPDTSIVKWTFPKTDKRDEVVMYWYDGNRPLLESSRPKDWDMPKLPTKGMLMIGKDHTISTGVRPNFEPRICDKKFFREFFVNYKKNNKNPIPRVREHSIFCEWIDAIKGNGPDCQGSFDYASQLTEVALLGCLVQRFGGSIEWDDAKMSCKGRPELDAFIKEPERKGWESLAQRPWDEQKPWWKFWGK